MQTTRNSILFSLDSRDVDVYTKNYHKLCLLKTFFPFHSSSLFKGIFPKGKICWGLMDSLEILDFWCKFLVF
jgi:hypothetical protein